MVAVRKDFQLAGESVGIGGGESPSPIGWEKVAGRSVEGQLSRAAQHIQPRTPIAIASRRFRGFTFAALGDADSIQSSKGAIPFNIRTFPGKDILK